MKFLAVACLLVVTLTARESLAQDAASGDGTSAIIAAGLNLAGGIVQGLNRKYSSFTSCQHTHAI